jgi:sulfur carrier protein ThiS
MVLLFIGGPRLHAGDVLDRIVATVNGHIILQSDWQGAISYAALVDGRTVDQISSSERKAALDRLIDQELLIEQMHSADIPHASNDEIATRIQEIRKQYPQARDDQGWENLLAQYGLAEQEFDERVALQVNLDRLVDRRLRPGIDIDAGSIERYYNQELLPQLRQSGAGDVALAEVTPKIKELLTQQKMNELLVAWLQNLRSGSEIQTEAAPEARDGLR